MYSEEDINSAVTAGIFSQETAGAFRHHVARQRRMPRVDEEAFRLITGFNDIFVVIACVLLLVSIEWIGSVTAEWIGGAGVAVTAWILAEFFTRKRRMALPSIVLLVACVGGVVWAWLSYFGNEEKHLIGAGAAAAGIAYLHWRRFKVPITVAAGTAALLACLAAVLISSIPQPQEWTSMISLVSGLFVFVWAMYWDGKDTQRQTWRSDVAFWLHLLAAPLIVHPIFIALSLTRYGEVAVMDAFVVVAVYFLLGLLSLAIDRRALMVSALAYVLYTISSLLKHYGMVSMGFAITALIIGSALLLLSAFWQGARARLVQWLPLALQKRLPAVQGDTLGKAVG